MSTSKLSKRPISTFPINSSVLGKLTLAGLTTVQDIKPFSDPAELADAAGILHTEAVNVIDTVFGDNSRKENEVVTLKYKSALDLWKKRQEQGSIVTFCSRLDSMLEGGIHVGSITEVSGVPGIGKTQLCMQLAVDVHIPESLGGLAGESVYVDTEGSLVAQRLADLAGAVVEHCRLNGPASSDGGDLPAVTLEKILKGIHCFRCQDHSELLATVHLLQKFLVQHSKVKLVVVDSVAAPFRSYVEDLSQRTRLLVTLSQSLLKLASQHNIAVVLTNQMTTRILPGGQATVIPALGESWGHSCALRLLLHWDRSTGGTSVSTQCRQRRASLVKCAHHPRLSCPFTVNHSGIRDVISETDHVEKSESSLRENRQDSSCSDTVPGSLARVDVKLEGFPPPEKRQKKS